MAMLLGATIVWALSGLLFFLAFHALGLRFVPSHATNARPFRQASTRPNDLGDTAELGGRGYF